MTALPTLGREGLDDERVLGVLSRYVSKITARGLIESARREPAVAALAGTEAGRQRLVQKLASGVRLFTDERTYRKVLDELGSLREAPPPSSRASGATGPSGATGASGQGQGQGQGQAPSAAEAPALDAAPTKIEIRHENDLARARSAARELCQSLGVRPMVLQKVATIVSELARNMVSYAGGGELTIAYRSVPSKTIIITSVDKGAGIPNLPDILAGRYRSKTGLGLGILGTKRLANGFQIESGPGGTRVEAEVIL